MARHSRRQFLQGSLALAGIGLLAGCGLMPAPVRPGKVTVVGFLTGSSQAAVHAQTEAFRQGLRELGYVEGENIRLELRFGDGRDERLPELAAELVGLGVSVLVASGSPPALVAKAATGSIPVVATSTDPVGIGLVASLAHPGGNVTGLSYASALLGGKKLELLKEVSPAASRVVALWYAPNAASAVQLREVGDAARQLSLQVQPVGVQGPEGFEAAFQAIAREGADALYLIDSPETFTRRARILEFVGSIRLPAMYPRREWVEGGGLMAYGVNFPDVHRRAAAYVDKILKGTKPADLPVELPTKFDFLVNLKTAQAPERSSG